MQGDFAGQQNFAITQAVGDWLLFLDCDERITKPLATEITQVINSAKKAYRIRRLNHFAGENAYFEGRVHQKLKHPYPEKTLKNAMLHYTYSSWTQYYSKFEQYTRLSAEQYYQQGKTAGFTKDILLRPLWAFIKMYAIHGGFLDGRLGWLLAVNHYYYTMTKYSRLYSLQHFGKDSL